MGVMADREDASLPPELAEVAARLVAAKPESPAELGRIRLRAKAGAEQTTQRSNQRGPLMKSRLALAVMLALGMLFTFSGAWAVADGFNDAAETQYRDNDHDGRDFDSVGSGGGHVDHNDVDSATQDAVGGGNLAFTGFAAIPLLIIGGALLGGGAVLSIRRKE